MDEYREVLSSLSDNNPAQLRRCGPGGAVTEWEYECVAVCVVRMGMCVCVFDGGMAKGGWESGGMDVYK